MGLSLYRKYRPQVFADVIGQESVIATLLSQSKQREFTHAYLFTGPRGVGKTTVARLLAKAVNAEKVTKTGDIENDCASCKLINEGKAIDIMEIDAASHTGVDHVRTAIIDTARTTPSVLRYKVFIIDEVHMLSTSAFNALLKILEEPPAHVIFILATTEVQKVPSTIISRCQRFAFRRIGIEDLTKRLSWIAKEEKVKVDEEVLKEIALRSEGSSRDAESLLGQLLAFGEKHITAADAEIILPRSTITDVSSFVTLLSQNKLSEAIAFLSAFVDQGGQPEQFMADVIVYFRYMLLYATGSERLITLVATLVPKAILSAMQKQLQHYKSALVLRHLELFVRAKKTYAYQDIPELPLEIATYEALLDEQHRTDVKPPAPTAPEARRHEALDLVRTTPKKTPGDISLKVVQEKWQQFTNQVRQQNRGLSLSLQVSRPVDVSGTTVTLAVPYPFHKERIEQTKHKLLIEEVLRTYFGKAIAITCTLQTDVNRDPVVENVEPVEGEGLWGQVLEAFGGELAK